MYICICKNVTDRQIRRAVHEQSLCSIRGLRQELGVCGQCGKCAPEVRQIIRECQHEQALPEPPPLLAGCR